MVSPINAKKGNKSWRGVWLLSLLSSSVKSFVPASSNWGIQRRASLIPLEQAVGDSESAWMEALKARQLELDQEKHIVEQKWRNADCSSTRDVLLPSWVRRIDVDYPLVACGSATDQVFVSNLETGEILAESRSEEEEQEDEPSIHGAKQILRRLYGNYDGGGTIAIAMEGDLVCEASRKGSVNVWRLDGSSRKMVSQGKMRALEGILVTSLQVAEEYLWVGSADGRLQAFPLDSDLPLSMQSEPDYVWEFDSPILSLSLCPDIGHGVVTTADETVELFSMDEDGGPLASFCPPLAEPRSRDFDDPVVLSACLCRLPKSKTYAIACGGSDGGLFLQALTMKGDDINDYRPFAGHLRKLTPKHQGPVKCVSSPRPGLLVSGGLDGCLRVWDIEDEICLYQFVGYKVWLGSVWTDGMRVISDGSDNAVVMHDFKESEDEL